MSDTPVKISELVDIVDDFSEDDLIPVVDISDDTQSDSGTTKKSTLGNVIGFFRSLIAGGSDGAVQINVDGALGYDAGLNFDADGLHVGTPGGQEARIKPLEILLKKFGGSGIAFSASGLGPALFGIGGEFQKAAYFNEELANTVSGGATAIDWTQQNKQSLTLSENSTVTFSDPAGPASFILRVIQDATGGRTITWPEDILWPGSEEPTLSSDPDAIDIISIYFDGTQYYGSYSLNFGVAA